MINIPDIKSVVKISKLILLIGLVYNSLNLFGQDDSDKLYYGKKGFLINQHVIIKIYNNKARLIIINTAGESAYGVELYADLFPVDTVIEKKKIIYKSSDDSIHVIKNSDRVFVEIKNQKKIRVKLTDSHLPKIKELLDLIKADLNSRTENIKRSLDLSKKLNKK